MSTKLRQDLQEPLTYRNAPRVQRDGHSFVEDRAALDLMLRIAAEEQDLLDALAAQ